MLKMILEGHLYLSKNYVISYLPMRCKINMLILTSKLIVLFKESRQYNLNRCSKNNKCKCTITFHK